MRKPSNFSIPGPASPAPFSVIPLTRRDVPLVTFCQRYYLDERGL